MEARLLSQGQILAEWWQEVKENFFQDTIPDHATKNVSF